MSNTIEYTGRVLPGGALELPVLVQRELHLRPNMQVKIVLSRADDDDAERLAQRRAEVWRQVDAVRELLSGKDFSLTDAVIASRREEDETL